MEDRDDLKPKAINNLVKLFRRANKTKVGRDSQGLLPRESILKFHDQTNKDLRKF